MRKGRLNSSCPKRFFSPLPPPPFLLSPTQSEFFLSYGNIREQRFFFLFLHALLFPPLWPNGRLHARTNTGEELFFFPPPPPLFEPTGEIRDGPGAFFFPLIIPPFLPASQFKMLGNFRLSGALSFFFFFFFPSLFFPFPLPCGLFKKRLANGPGGRSFSPPLPFLFSLLSCPPGYLLVKQRDGYPFSFSLSSNR